MFWRFQNWFASLHIWSGGLKTGFINRKWTQTLDVEHVEVILFDNGFSVRIKADDNGGRELHATIVNTATLKSFNAKNIALAKVCTFKHIPVILAKL